MLTETQTKIIKEEYETILNIDEITHDRNTTLAIYMKMRKVK